MGDGTALISLRLAGRSALVVGGGAVATRKTAWLLNGGARVVTISLTFHARLAALAAAESERLTLVQRAWGPIDLSPYALVVAATDERGTNRRVAEAAEAAGVPVNVADDPELCTFVVPATVRRGALEVAVTTGGQAPALAARIRRQWEEAYPPWYGDYVAALGEVRRWLRDHCRDGGTRRRVLGELAAEGLETQLRWERGETLTERLRQVARELLEDPKDL